MTMMLSNAKEYRQAEELQALEDEMHARYGR
jgi:hypothetical protein